MTTQEIINAIANARKEAKIGQKELAEMAHTTRTHWGRIERGASTPGADILIDAANAVGLELIITKKYTNE